MEIINEEFRILSIKNFFNPDQKEKEWMKVMVDLNKEIYHKPVATKLGPYNWGIIDGEISLFDDLYQKYLECCFDIFENLLFLLQTYLLAIHIAETKKIWGREYQIGGMIIVKHHQ